MTKFTKDHEYITDDGTVGITPYAQDQRGDIVFVPRSTLGELAAFFTQVRSALPIGFSYAIGGGNGFASF